MRIEFTGRKHSLPTGEEFVAAEIIIEVGDRVTLVDSHTREILAEIRTVERVPCRFDWRDLRVGRYDRYIGWALLAEEDDEILYIGDAHRLNSGDAYTLDIPDRGSDDPPQE